MLFLKGGAPVTGHKHRLINRMNVPWQSNLHLARDLEPVVGTSGFTVQVGARRIRAEFRGEGCEIRLVKGQTDPYQVWVSVGYQKLGPAPVVIALCPADLAHTEWRIDLDAA